MSKRDNALHLVGIMNDLIPQHLETSIKVLMGHDNSKELQYISYLVFKELFLFGTLNRTLQGLKGIKQSDIKLFNNLASEYISKPMNPNLVTMIVIRTKLLEYLKEYSLADKEIDYPALYNVAELIEHLSKPKHLPPLVEKDGNYKIFYVIPETDVLHLSFLRKKSLIYYLGLIKEDLRQKVAMGKTLEAFSPRDIDIVKIRKEIEKVKFLA